MRITQYIRQHHIGLIALFVAMTGTAYAGTQMANRQTGTQPLKAKKKKRGVPGPAGPAGANGTNGANGAAGTARAYAVVGTGCAGTTPFACPVARSSGITAANRPQTGYYCIRAPGLDPQAIAPAVSIEVNNTVGGGFAQPNVVPTICSVNGFDGAFQVETTDTNAIHINSIGFTIVIP